MSEVSIPQAHSEIVRYESELPVPDSQILTDRVLFRSDCSYVVRV
jgi:hypothetical protein